MGVYNPPQTPAGSTVIGTATLNFGSAPGTNQVKVTVSDSGVQSTSFLVAVLMAVSTATHNAYEHNIVDMTLRCGNIVPGVSFDIVATSNWRLSGTFTARWSRN